MRLFALFLVLGSASDAARESVAPARRLVLQPLDGPFSESARSDDDAPDPWTGKCFVEHRPTVYSTHVKANAIGIVLRKRTQQYWIEVETGRGKFYARGPFGTAKPNSKVEYCRRETVGRFELLIWSSGMGIIDPPNDQAFTACKHHFVACTLDEEIPRCAAVITAATAKRCVADRSDLPGEAPEARLLVDGETFEISGRRYTVKEPRPPKNGD